MSQVGIDVSVQTEVLKSDVSVQVDDSIFVSLLKEYGVSPKWGAHDWMCDNYRHSYGLLPGPGPLSKRFTVEAAILPCLMDLARAIDHSYVCSYHTSNHELPT